MSELQAPKKPKQGRGRLAAVAPAPKVEEVPKNLAEADAERIVDMSFKVPEPFRRDYKMVATAHGMSMVALLREGFELWKEKNGIAD
ncbi:MAG: hypothetical protein JJ979_11970 [Roseibium sp.]|nr:hypothetical protein [Roseibium sp.]